MPHPRGKIEKAERWAIMEWIVVGRRIWLVAGLAAILALIVVGGILYADGVSHLNHGELGRFLRQQEEFPKARGPLFGRLHEPVER